jgi:hypothetical protein
MRGHCWRALQRKGPRFTSQTRMQSACPSTLIGVRLGDETLDFQIADHILLREHAYFGQPAVAHFVHPLGVADQAAANRDQIELAIVEAAQ